MLRVHTDVPSISVEIHVRSLSNVPSISGEIHVDDRRREAHPPSGGKYTQRVSAPSKIGFFLRAVNVANAQISQS